MAASLLGRDKFLHTRTEEDGSDLVVINLHRPNMHPLNNISKNLVYAGSKENVRMTMVNGKVLYENGEFFIGDDAGKIFAEADKISESLK